MPTEILHKNDTIITVKTGGDAGITLANLPYTDARQSAKFDFGATRADVWGVLVSIETSGVAPAAGEVVEFYISPSPDNTLFAGGASGVDALYKSGEESEWVKQLVLVGVLIMTNDIRIIQTAQVGTYRPIMRYGSLIVKNESGQSFESNDDEHQIQLVPILPESQ